jgi:hypothetical protein
MRAVRRIRKRRAAYSFRSEKVPENFILALSADGAATRYCRVVWRTDKQVGVEFVERPANIARKHPVPTKVEPASKTKA